MPELWMKLPEDIVYDSMPFAVYAVLTRNRANRGAAAKLSMTCRRWLKQLRALLFHSIKLQTPSDCRFLETILSSTRSGWLKDYISQLSVLLADEPNTEHLFFSAWRSLVAHIHLRVDTLDITGNSAYLFPAKLFMPQPCLPSPSPQTTLKELSLSDLHFASLFTLLRAIGNISCLENVVLQRVEWNKTCDSHLLPPLTAAFPSIKQVFAAGCTELWPFAWIFATSSLHYGRLRRGPFRPMGQSLHHVRADMHAIVEAARMVCHVGEGYAYNFRARYHDTVPEGK